MKIQLFTILMAVSTFSASTAFSDDEATGACTASNPESAACQPAAELTTAMQVTELSLGCDPAVAGYALPSAWHKGAEAYLEAEQKQQAADQSNVVKGEQNAGLSCRLVFGRDGKEMKMQLKDMLIRQNTTSWMNALYGQKVNYYTGTVTPMEGETCIKHVDPILAQKNKEGDVTNHHYAGGDPKQSMNHLGENAPERNIASRDCGNFCAWRVSQSGSGFLDTNNAWSFAYDDQAPKSCQLESSWSRGLYVFTQAHFEADTLSKIYDLSPSKPYKLADLEGVKPCSANASDIVALTKQIKDDVYRYYLKTGAPYNQRTFANLHPEPVKTAWKDQLEICSYAAQCMGDAKEMNKNLESCKQFESKLKTVAVDTAWGDINAPKGLFHALLNEKHEFDPSKLPSGGVCHLTMAQEKLFALWTKLVSCEVNAQAQASFIKQDIAKKIHTQNFNGDSYGNFIDQRVEAENEVEDDKYSTQFFNTQFYQPVVNKAFTQAYRKVACGGGECPDTKIIPSDINTRVINAKKVVDEQQRKAREEEFKKELEKDKGVTSQNMPDSGQPSRSVARHGSLASSMASALISVVTTSAHAGLFTSNHITSDLCAEHNKMPRPACESECPCGGHSKIDLTTQDDPSCTMASVSEDARAADAGAIAASANEDSNHFRDQLPTGQSPAVMVQGMNNPSGASAPSGESGSTTTTDPTSSTTTGSGGSGTAGSSAEAGDVTKDPAVTAARKSAGGEAKSGAILRDDAQASAVAGAPGVTSTATGSTAGAGSPTAPNGAQSESLAATAAARFLAGAGKDEYAAGSNGPAAISGQRGNADNSVESSSGVSMATDEAYLKQNASVSLFQVVSRRYEAWEKE